VLTRDIQISFCRRGPLNLTSYEFRYSELTSQVRINPSL
jgi:hypothetical protein